MRAVILRIRPNFDLTPLLSVTLVDCTARHRRLLEPGEVTELPRIAAARSDPARIGPDPGPLLAGSGRSEPIGQGRSSAYGMAAQQRWRKRRVARTFNGITLERSPLGGPMRCLPKFGAAPESTYE